MKTLFAALMIIAAVSKGSDVDAEEALIKIVNGVGNDCEAVEISHVSSENSFVLGLSEEDFAAVTSAVITYDRGTDGGVKSVMVTSDSKSAKKLYEKLWKSYEFPACDKAEKIIFLKAGNCVAFFKGRSENVNAYSRAFGDIFGAEGMKIIKNSVKTQ